MNIYLMIAGAAVVLASYAGTFYVGADYGESRQVARQASAQDIADKAAEKSAQIAAKAISGIEVKHQTINQKVIREIQTSTVYADCRHTDGVLKSLNEALTGRPDATPGSKLPATNGAGRQPVRNDDSKVDGISLYLQKMQSGVRPAR